MDIIYKIQIILSKIHVKNVMIYVNIVQNLKAVYKVIV